MVFPKKIALEYDLSCIIRKDDISFSINMIVPIRRKMKDDLCRKKKKKIHGNMFSSNVLKRWSFQKNCTGAWSFLYYLQRWSFFPGKHDIFSLEEIWKMIFLKKYMERWYFLYISTDVTNMILCPSAKKTKKNKRCSYPAKIHLKETLDLRSRKSSSNSLFFYGDLYRPFHILLSSEKNQET